MANALWARSATAIFTCLVALSAQPAAATIDEIAGLITSEPGFRLVKRFQVPSGSVILGVEFLNNDARTVFPKVSILRGPATRLSEATVLAELTNVRETSRHRVRMTVSPILVDSPSVVLVAVSFPASSGVRGVGEGAGIGATRITTPSDCFVAPNPDEAFQMVDLDLGIKLLFQEAGKAGLTNDGPTRVRADYLQSANPSHRVATIQFGLERTKRVKLGIYDVAGREVRLLADGLFEAGIHSRDWDGCDEAGKNVASGVYFALLVSGDKSLTQKLVLTK